MIFVTLLLYWQVQYLMDQNPCGSNEHKQIELNWNEKNVPHQVTSKAVQRLESNNSAKEKQTCDINYIFQ